MKILVTGTTGQVGWELKRTLAPLGELLTPERSSFDLASPTTLSSRLDDLRPDLIVNPAAYTAVDRAESERDAALAVNRDGPAAMAEWCKRHGRGLVHLSTDYVYSGAGDRPWKESDPVSPVNTYGETKLLGEEAIRASGCDSLIFRTSWVYSHRGGNFLLTMMKLAASGKPLKIVSDQHGAPTSARLIATTIAAILHRSGRAERFSLPAGGTFHLCASGTTSWHGFAQEIFRLRSELTGAPAIEAGKTSTAEYKTPAARPLNSRLELEKLRSTFGLQMPDWKASLAQLMLDAASPLASQLSEQSRLRSTAS